MQPIDVTLGLAPEIRAGLTDGRYRLDGGVVRDCASGRIVALPPGCEPRSTSLGELGLDGIQALAGLFRARGEAAQVGAVAAQLALLADELKAVRSVVEVVAAQLDGLLLGRLAGTLRAYGLDAATATPAELRAYRRELLEAHEALAATVDGLLASPRALRDCPSAVARCAKAALVAGAAARDASLRLGDLSAVREISRSLAMGGAARARILRERVAAPSALFWVADGHRAAVVELRESARVLAAQHEQLELDCAIV